MTVPYLINFVPYTIVGDRCQSIDDMVSVSLQQRYATTKIDYNVGSNDDVSFPIQIKNITNNADLEVTVSFQKNAFLLTGKANVETFILKPEQTKNIDVSLNKESLDAVVGDINTNITVSIKNITNGGLVLKNSGVSKLAVNFLNETISVVS